MGRPRGTAVLYHDIAKRLLARIRRGKWHQDAILPSYTELAEDFKTGILTVRRALAYMEKEGKLARTPQGKWTVIDPEHMMHLYANRVVMVSNIGLNHYWKSNTDGFHLTRKGIELALGEKERQLQIVSRYPYNKKSNQMVIPGLSSDQDVIGVLLCGVFSKKCQQGYSALKIPVVLVDVPPTIDGMAAVCVANEAAAHDAVQRLAHLGHRRIAFCRRVQISIAEIDPDSLARQQGFLSGLKSCGISGGKDAIFNFFTRQGKVDTAPIQSIFGARPHFTAVLVVDNLIASMIAHAAKVVEMVLPRDLAIVCFSESGAKWSGPRVDFEQIGREAVALLESGEVKQIRILTTWHEGSTMGEPLSAKRR
jgi:DNA-binding LacI/PurR family transcriptional regulator/DNA-binding transcriptional regulator YhcF (GntR family)